MRLPLAIGIAALAASSHPVLSEAREPDMGCVMAETTASYRAELALAVHSGPADETRDAKVAPLQRAVDKCFAASGLAPGKAKAYFDLALSITVREWLMQKMRAVSLDPALVDKALDFGPGRTNPSLDPEISDAQIGAIISAFVDAGVTIDKVSQESWALVGGYAGATAMFWQLAQAFE